MLNSQKNKKAIYQEILSSSFENIVKILPKKYLDLKEFIIKGINEIKFDKTQNAVKYFNIIKLCLETKISKIIEIILSCLLELLKNDCIDNLNDYYSAIFELDSNCNIKKQNTNLKIMDLLISMLLTLNENIEEHNQILLFNVLLEIIKNSKFLDENNFYNIINYFIFHLKNLKSINLQIQSKNYLTEIIDLSFHRLIEVIGLEHINSRTEVSNSLSHININSNQLSGSKSTKEKNPYRASIFDSKKLISFESASLMDSTLENFMKSFMNNLNDDVCVYLEKINYLEKYFNEDESTLFSKEMIEKEIKAIPLKINYDDSNEEIYHKIIPIVLTNEKEQSLGKFGWCFVCRKTADLYCKNSKAPICSQECKTINLQMTEHIDKSHFQNLINICYLKNGKILLKRLIALTNNEISNNTNEIKFLNVILDLVMKIIENKKQTIMLYRDLIELIKFNFCESLMKNCLHSEQQIFSLSFDIFVVLVIKYKDYLKQEISVFIDHIFLKILYSDISSYIHHFLVLQIFNKILTYDHIIYEFYVNYDCDVHSVSILEKMIDCLSRIAQGKFLKAEFSNCINSNQEIILKKLALETLVEILKLLIKHIEETEKEINSSENDESTKMENNTNNLEETFEEENNKTEYHESIEKNRTIKQDMQIAIHKFNSKPKNGIQFLISNGYLTENNSEELAKFLFNTPNISKNRLGEFFGSENSFNLQVLSDFADKINFNKQSIDEGLRIFLDYFILPGESQKVDRIIQVFAQKYFNQNVEITPLKSTTSTYTFSYLLIMLQTDLHNPQVKEKMKISEFCKLAKGINDGEDLSNEYLTSIYQKVLKKPLALYEKKIKSKTNESKYINIKRKFLKETEEIYEKGKEMMQISRDKTFIIISSCEYSQQVLNILWSPCLAAFSIILEESDDSLLWEISLQGFGMGIKLTSIFNMNMEREAFVKGLVKFATAISIKDIKKKNYFCMEGLIQITLNYGQFLKGAWYYVLECLSKAEYYPNFDLAMIEKIFHQSILLDTESILEFITALCKLSEDELKANKLKIFYLQKIVEVTDFNMDRIRIVWTKIWYILKEFFIKAGCNENEEIAVSVIDSLKQLSKKFLIKEELSQYEFQKEFLNPFEIIFLNCHKNIFEIKEFIMRCMLLFVQIRYNELKSGWKCIFTLIKLSLLEFHENLIKISKEIICEIIHRENFEAISEFYQEIIEVIILLAKNPSFMGFGFDNFRKLLIGLSIEKNSNLIRSLLKKNFEEFILLFPSQNPIFQMKYLETFFFVLNKMGLLLDRSIWENIAKIHVIRIIKCLDESKISLKEHKTNPLHFFFNNLSEIFKKNFYFLKDFFDIWFELILYSVETYNETIAEYAMILIKNMISQNRNEIDLKLWRKILKLIDQIYFLSKPIELVNFDEKLVESLESEQEKMFEFGKIQINYEKCVIKCIIQLFLMKQIKEIVSKNVPFEVEDYKSLFIISHNSYEFSEKFNLQVILRYTLWKNGFMKDLKQLPGLLKQQKEAIICIITILFVKYQNFIDLKHDHLAELLKYSYSLINRFLSLIKKLNQASYYNNRLKAESLISKLNEEQINNELSSRKSVKLKQNHEFILSDIQISEYQRELISLKSILGSHLFLNLLEIDLALVGIELKTLLPILIEISNEECFICKFGESFGKIQSDDQDFFGNNLKKLLIKISEFLLNKIYC